MTEGPNDRGSVLLVGLEDAEQPLVAEQLLAGEGEVELVRLVDHAHQQPQVDLAVYRRDPDGEHDLLTVLPKDRLDRHVVGAVDDVGHRLVHVDVLMLSGRRRGSGTVDQPAGLTVRRPGTISDRKGALCGTLRRSA